MDQFEFFTKNKCKYVKKQLEPNGLKIGLNKLSSSINNLMIKFLTRAYATARFGQKLALQSNSHQEKTVQSFESTQNHGEHFNCEYTRSDFKLELSSPIGANWKQ